MQINNGTNQNLLNPATSHHRLHGDLAEYLQGARDINSAKKGLGPDFIKESPDIDALHGKKASQIRKEYVSPFKGLDLKTVSAPVRKLLTNETEYIDAIDNRRRATTYAVIPNDFIESNGGQEGFHDLMKEAANDPAAQKHMQDKFNVPDTGLVNFIIDDSDIGNDEDPIGLDFQRSNAIFEDGSNDLLPVIQGATGFNELTPNPKLQEYIRTAKDGIPHARMVALLADGRIVKKPSTGDLKHLHNTTNNVAYNQDHLEADFQIRHLLNGSVIPIASPYLEDEAKELIKSGVIPQPEGNDPLSMFLLDRTNPFVEREAKNYRYDSESRSFKDTRRHPTEMEEEYQRRVMYELLSVRVPFTISSKKLMCLHNA